MLVVGWILAAIVFAVLFSLVKTIDRLVYSVELVHARLDQMSASLTEVVATLDALHAHRTTPLDTRPPRMIERSASQ